MARSRARRFAGVGLALAIAVTLPASPWRQALAQRAAQSAKAVPPLDADDTPLTSKSIAGHRLWLIMFDKTAMRIDDIQRASDYTLDWSAKKTPNVDVIAVAVIGVKGLEVRQDFTSNDVKIHRVLAAFANEASDAGALGADARSEGLQRLCEVLMAWPERKDILAFSSGVVAGDPFRYREAVNTCEKANVTISSYDARGLRVGRGRLQGRPVGEQ